MSDHEALSLREDFFDMMRFKKSTMLDSMSNMMNQIDTADTSISAEARDDVVSGQNSDRLYDTGEIIEVFANLLQKFDGIDGAEAQLEELDFMDHILAAKRHGIRKLLQSSYQGIEASMNSDECYLRDQREQLSQAAKLDDAHVGLLLKLESEEQRMAGELDEKLAAKKQELEAVGRKSAELARREARLQLQLDQQSAMARPMVQNANEEAVDEDSEAAMYEMLLQKKAALQTHLAEALQQQSSGESQPSDDGDTGSVGSDVESYMNEGVMQIKAAIEADTNQDYESAIMHYSQGCELLFNAMQHEDDEQAKLEIQSKLGDYMMRLQTLKSAFQEEEAAYDPENSMGVGSDGNNAETLDEPLDVEAAAEYIQDLVRQNQLEPAEAMEIMDDLLQKEQARRQSEVLSQLETEAGQQTAELEAQLVAKRNQLAEEEELTAMLQARKAELEFEAPQEAANDQYEDAQAMYQMLLHKKESLQAQLESAQDPDRMSPDKTIAPSSIPSEVVYSDDTEDDTDNSDMFDQRAIMAYRQSLIEKQGLDPREADSIVVEILRQKREEMSATSSMMEERGQNAETTQQDDGSGNPLNLDEAMGMMNKLLREKEKLELELKSKLAHASGPALDGSEGYTDEEAMDALGSVGDAELDAMGPAEASKYMDALMEQKNMLEGRLNAKMQIQQELQEQAHRNAAGIDPAVAAQMLDEIIMRLDDLPAPEQRTAEDTEVETFLRSKLMELQYGLQAQLTESERGLAMAERAQAEADGDAAGDAAGDADEDGDDPNVDPTQAMAMLEQLMQQKDSLQGELRSKLAQMAADSPTSEVASTAAAMLAEQRASDKELEQEMSELRQMLAMQLQSGGNGTKGGMDVPNAIEQLQQLYGQKKTLQYQLEQELEREEQNEEEQEDAVVPTAPYPMQVTRMDTQKWSRAEQAMPTVGQSPKTARNDQDKGHSEDLQLRAMETLTQQKEMLEAELQEKEQEHMQAEEMEQKLSQLLQEKEKEQAMLSQRLTEEHREGTGDLGKLLEQKRQLEEMLAAERGALDTVGADYDDAVDADYSSSSIGEERGEEATGEEQSEIEAYMMGKYMAEERERMLEAMTELQREKDRLQQLMEHEELLQEELRSREAKMRDAQEQVDTAPTPAVEEVSESEYDTSIEGADGQLSREAFRACLAGEAATLQELFDQGADLSLMKTIPDGKTLGHLAAFRGHIDVLRLLGRCGVSLEEQTSEGLLPAHYAVFSDNVSVLRYLMVRGCDLLSDATEDQDGRTPLILSEAINSHECFDFLNSLQSAWNQQQG